MKTAVLVATITLAVAAMHAATGVTDAQAAVTPTPEPTPTATPALVTRVLADVRVHSGQTATVRYRVDDGASTTATETASVTVVVQDADGQVLYTLTRNHPVQVGAEQGWSGKLRIRAGQYLLVAHAVDAGGQPEAQAVAAHLRVLEALPPLVPTTAALEQAFAWASGRLGQVSVAVVDSRGELHGLHPWRQFASASVVKAMLLVAYLRGHPSLSPGMRHVLQRMIDYSDNAAADLVYARVGRRGLVRLAHAAGMRGFQPSGGWITTRITAADMAYFFRDMERYVPAAHRGFANSLLAGITSSQRWGIPAAARPLDYRVYFKGGWLGAFILASQAARLERGTVRLGLAVLTNGNPPSSYGPETIRGVTARLLRR